MGTYRDVKAGDKVLVFDVNGKRMGQPEGGWEGEVVKAGPKLVYVTYGGLYGPTRGRGQAFRRSTGIANDDYGHQSFMTHEEYAEEARRRAAVTALREYGVTWAGNRPAPSIVTETLEKMLAALDQQDKKESQNAHESA